MAQPSPLPSTDTTALDDNDVISSDEASTESESDTEYNELADLPEHLQLNLSTIPELFEPLLDDIPEFDLNLLQTIIDRYSADKSYANWLASRNPDKPKKNCA